MESRARPRGRAVGETPFSIKIKQAAYCFPYIASILGAQPPDPAKPSQNPPAF